MKLKKMIWGTTGAAMLLGTEVLWPWIDAYFLSRGPETAAEGEDYGEYLAVRAHEAMEYARLRGLNTNYCMLVDYGVESGQPRAFVWKDDEQRVVISSHAMHGSGGGSTAERPVFSNVPGSKCTSLGHFLITRERGSTVEHGYMLRGLDSDNVTAYERALMVHATRWVDTNCRKRFIPLNSYACQGCVAVTTWGMLRLERIVENEDKLMVLWAFDSTANNVDEEKNDYE